MSGIDDFFPGDDDEAPRPAPDEPEQKRVTTSRADDILDAVEGVRTVGRTRDCKACGSANTTIRGNSVTGGAQVLLCRDCRCEIPWASVQASDVQLGPVRAVGGPYYSPDPQPKPDGNQSSFSRKGKKR
jgi:hypothetical protein